MPLHIEEILAAPRAGMSPSEPRLLGHSREGRPIVGHRFGTGSFRISLIAGCHADEPVGPRLLGHLVGCLASFPPTHEALTDHAWWVVPHVNPDGAERNRVWSDTDADHYGHDTYARHVVRERPGDDIEFGFPRDPGDTEARPENRAVFDWWRRSGRPFHLHVSLHGMARAAGPWFLVEPAWRDRCELLQETCRRDVARLGYRLHDVDRRGEKGFHRLGEGFSTRPDSRAMAAYFIERGDPGTAALFRPSSMEAVRGLGGDPLTLVSEMPLFIEEPDRPTATIDAADRRPATGGSTDAAGDAPARRPMSIRDQMALQWALILAGIRQVRAATPDRRGTIA